MTHLVGAWQVSEQVLKALGVEVCADLIANRGLLAALFSPISADFFMEVGLGHRQRSLQICGYNTHTSRTGIFHVKASRHRAILGSVNRRCTMPQYVQTP